MQRNFIKVGVPLTGIKTIAIRFVLTFLSSTAISSLLFVDYAFAYLGPGAGLSALGSLLALIGIVVLAIAGFLWYPIKRMVTRSKTKEKKNDDS
ncbi:MAG: hypothetical protein ACR2O3_00890 [Rhizobiaceae bacterium]